MLVDGTRRNISQALVNVAVNLSLPLSILTECLPQVFLNRWVQSCLAGITQNLIADLCVSFHCADDISMHDSSGWRFSSLRRFDCEDRQSSQCEQCCEGAIHHVLPLSERRLLFAGSTKSTQPADFAGWVVSCFIAEV